MFSLSLLLIWTVCVFPSRCYTLLSSHNQGANYVCWFSFRWSQMLSNIWFCCVTFTSSTTISSSIIYLAQLTATSSADTSIFNFFIGFTSTQRWLHHFQKYCDTTFYSRHLFTKAVCYNTIKYTKSDGTLVSTTITLILWITVL